MNEQIRELLEQAGVKYSIMPKDTVYEKFAELIVRECASMARVYCSHEFDFTGELELDEFMLKHFGVES